MAFNEFNQQWLLHRRRLEREIRVLVVESHAEERKDFEDLLYRCRLSARMVNSGDQAATLISQGHYSLVVIPEVLPGMNGVTLLRKLRKDFPDTDFILSTRAPSLELVTWAFELGTRAIIHKPIKSYREVSDQLYNVARKNVDRRMRQFLLDQLRRYLSELAPETSEHISSQMEVRLSAFKRHLGPCNRVLVLELDEQTRRLSESLHLAGLKVETVGEVKIALSRINQQGINLLILRADELAKHLPAMMRTLSELDPRLEVIFTARHPQVSTALAALEHGAAFYAARMHDPPMMVVDQASEVLFRRRRKRLRDNLLVELYLGVMAIVSDMEEEEALDTLYELLTLPQPLELLPPLPSEDEEEVQDSVGYLDSVLSRILASDATGPNRWSRLQSDSEPTQEEKEEAEGAERRIHERLEENQFVRFRPDEEPAFTVAAVGNISKGGLFICTDEPLPRGTITELDFNLDLDDQSYHVCCISRVAWVAREENDAYPEIGFGVEFLDLPEDVVQLIKRAVSSRAAGAAPA